jgi:hypothetical protein
MNNFSSLFSLIYAVIYAVIFAKRQPKTFLSIDITGCPASLAVIPRIQSSNPYREKRLHPADAKLYNKSALNSH